MCFIGPNGRLELGLREDTYLEGISLSNACDRFDLSCDRLNEPLMLRQPCQVAESGGIFRHERRQLIAHDEGVNVEIGWVEWSTALVPPLVPRASEPRNPTFALGNCFARGARASSSLPP